MQLLKEFGKDERLHSLVSHAGTYYALVTRGRGGVIWMRVCNLLTGWEWCSPCPCGCAKTRLAFHLVGGDLLAGWGVNRVVGVESGETGKLLADESGATSGSLSTRKTWYRERDANIREDAKSYIVGTDTHVYMMGRMVREWGSVVMGPTLFDKVWPSIRRRKGQLVCYSRSGSATLLTAPNKRHRLMYFHTNRDGSVILAVSPQAVYQLSP